MMKPAIFLALFALARGQERCCPGIGCFNTGPPFGHLPAPNCPVTEGDNKAPNFQLFTRSNRANGQEITRTHIPSVFDGSKRTIFIIHGWWGARDDAWMHRIKDAVLTNFDNNVIVTGWAAGSVNLNYWQAASDTRTVGGEMAYIANRLLSNGARPDRLWCAGHSLGGHACGHFGKRAQSEHGFTIDRITGLDPAGPWFDDYDRRCGLTTTDARFVDVISTDKGELGTGEGDRGHAQFYPNGGTGDHFSCQDYFQESFSSECRFNARQSCSDVRQIPGSCSPCGGVCQVMGEPARGRSGRGMFYLTVNEDSPHCQG